MRQPPSLFQKPHSLWILLALAVFPGLPVVSQEADPAITPESLEKRAQRIFEAKEAIAKERAAWTEQKPLFESLIALREKEIAEIDGFTESAKSRVEEVSKKRADLETEESERKAWRAKFEGEVARLELSLKEAIPLLPPPVQTKAGPSISRLVEGSEREQIPLQERFRDVLSILSAARDFDSKLMIDSEVREIEGKRYQVDILYLGLDHAWFVDESGSIAGSGVPTANGWVWTEDRSLASQVRNAIDVNRREVPPAIVSLPFSDRPNTPSSDE